MLRPWLVIAAAVVSGSVLAAQSGYVPVRVFDDTRGQFSDFELMLADVAHADVLFIGEQHDDPNTHRLELAALEGLARRRGNVTLALEMFERDVQPVLSQLAAGQITEAAFLEASRPWPNYQTDYKPLVDFAIAHHWPVVASDVPRSIAAAVSKQGVEVLAAETPDEQKWFAADRQCPTDDDYFARFAEAMGGHPTSAPGIAMSASAERQGLERFYFAQCLKDETMGESVAQAWQAAAGGDERPLIVQVNGAFHTDFFEGTAARAMRRLPGKRIAVLSVLPVDDLDQLDAPDAAGRKRADYLVYTIK